MAWKNLQTFISALESRDQLIRVKTFADPVLEIAEITDRISKQPGGGKALLFENNGTDFPLLINMMGSEERISLALGKTSLDEVEGDLSSWMGKMMQGGKGWRERFSLLPLLAGIPGWFPRQKFGKAPCQECIMDIPDLRKLPLLQCWPHDGGRFITLPMVHTKDPDTGIRNVGMYRMQQMGPQLTGMHWHRHKTGARHFERYRQLNRRMPVAVTLGGDPACIYAATAPLPDNVDEYLFAGYLRRKSVAMVPCLTQELSVPASSDFVIEGYVDPSEPFVFEGPFGDHTGFYSEADYYPAFHITCITHRRDAVYPATLVGIPPQEDAFFAQLTEKIFAIPIRTLMQPELRNLHMPIAGTAHNLALASIRKTYPGHAFKVIQSMWGAGQMMMNKVFIVLDGELELTHYAEILKRGLLSVNFQRDLMFSKGPLDVLDHASPVFSFGSKLGIDLTEKFPEEMEESTQDNSLGQPATVDVASFVSALPFVYELAPEWLYQGIPLALMSIREACRADFDSFFRDGKPPAGWEWIRLWIWVDQSMDVHDPLLSSWWIFSNLDPERDIRIVGHQLFVNALSKTASMERNSRNWPNPVVMSEEVCSSVDEKWNEYFPGYSLLASPSERLRGLIRPGGAMVGRSS